MTRPAVPGSVLVVDDDRAMRETVVEILAATGIEAEGAGTAAEARERQERLAPSVALVDQRLPDATGIEVGSRLKERDADLTVLLVTGYANLENAIAAVWQFDGFLTKPVPPVELLRVVRAGLESAHLRRENRTLVAELQHTNAMLEASVADRTRELSGLLAMAETLAGATELDQVVDVCVRTASEVTAARYAELYLSEDGPGSPLLLRGRTGEERADGEQAVPLTAGGREIGNLVLGTTERPPPMFLATLAGSAAIAIQNAQRLDVERKAVEQLSELSRMKSTFLATVSHELRTPLTSMTGFAELLDRRFEAGRSGGAALHRRPDRGAGPAAARADRGPAGRDARGVRRAARDARAGRPSTTCWRASSAPSPRPPNPIVITSAAGVPPVSGDRQRIEQVVCQPGRQRDQALARRRPRGDRGGGGRRVRARGGDRPRERHRAEVPGPAVRAVHAGRERLRPGVGPRPRALHRARSGRGDGRYDRSEQPPRGRQRVRAAASARPALTAAGCREPCVRREPCLVP